MPLHTLAGSYLGESSNGGFQVVIDRLPKGIRFTGFRRGLEELGLHSS